MSAPKFTPGKFFVGPQVPDPVSDGMMFLVMGDNNGEPGMVCSAWHFDTAEMIVAALNNPTDPHLAGGIKTLFGPTGERPEDPGQALNCLLVNVLRSWDQNLIARFVGQLSERSIPAALDSVLAERGKQDVMWGQQNHHGFKWLAILGEEVGELSECVLHADYGGKAAAHTQEEAVQVAAVALAMVECIMRHGGQFPRVQEASR